MSNNVIGRKVAKEASISFGGMGMGSLFRYLFSIMMARWLGPQMLGIYSLGNAVTRIGEIFGIMGLDNGVLRYVSREKEENANVRNSIYSSIKMGFISSLVIGLLIYFCSDWIVLTLFNEGEFLSTVIKVYALTLPFTVTTLIASFATQGFKILKYKVFVNQIINPFTLLLTMILSYLFFGPNIAILAPTVVSAVIGFFLILYYLKNFVDISINKVFNAKFDNEILKFSLPLMFVSAIGIIMHWTDIIMLGVLDNAYSVGLYHPVERTAGLIRMILFAFASIFAPLFSQYFHEKNQTKMLEVFQLSTKWILLTSLPLFIFLILFSNTILMLFGSEFGNNALALPILTVGIMIQAVFGLGSPSLTMSGFQKYNLINALVALFTNIFLNIMLIPQFGIAGAAMGTTIALFLISLLRFVENYYLLGLNLLSTKLFKPILAGLSTGMIVYFVKPYMFESGYFDYHSSILHLIIYLLLGALFILLVYTILIWIFRLDDEDKDIVQVITNKLLK
jgi:O-antigen/teichoic acid export membrane protein